MDLSVRSAALEAPDGLAVVDGERELTWRDLAGQVARVRESLRPWLEAVCGRMAVVGGTGFESVTAILALLEEGRTCVLLHPRWSAAERERAVLQSGASVVIETDGALRKSPASPPAVGSADRIDRGRVIVFTSGTSGAPRGAVLRHSALLASARAHGAVFGWRKTDRWLLGLPTAHVGGLMIVVRSLAARRAVVLPDRTGRRTGFDPAELLRTVERTRVSLLSVVPTMLTRLLALKAGPPPSVRAVLVGGAPAAPALMARARRQGWPVYATYGLTEGCSQVATERPSSAAENGVGPPVPGVEVRIVPLPVVEAEPGGEPLRRYEGGRGAGAVGRIQIRGPVLLEGYLGADPGAPLERPFRAGGWFDTGDLGSLDRDGCLTVVGRRSDRILTGGENVDPTEVEAAVTSWPGAAAACVVGLPDDEWGEVVAAVVGRGARFAAGGGFPALERHLRGCLAGYKRPRRWRAVDALPTAPSGKVDRQACTALFAGRSAATAPGDGLQEPVE